MKQISLNLAILLLFAYVFLGNCHVGDPYPKPVSDPVTSVVDVFIATPASGTDLCGNLQYTFTGTAYSAAVVVDIIEDETTGMKSYQVSKVYDQAIHTVELAIDHDQFEKRTPCEIINVETRDVTLTKIVETDTGTETVTTVASLPVFTWQKTIPLVEYCVGNHAVNIKATNNVGTINKVSRDFTLTNCLLDAQVTDINGNIPVTGTTNDIQVFGDFTVSGTCDVAIPRNYATRDAIQVYVDYASNTQNVTTNFPLAGTVDGTNVYVSGIATWQASLNTNSFQPGVHLLCVRTYDQCGDFEEDCYMIGIATGICDIACNVTTPASSTHVFSGTIPVNDISGTADSNVSTGNCTITTVQLQVGSGGWYNTDLSGQGLPDGTWSLTEVIDTSLYESYVEEGETIPGTPQILRIRTIAKDDSNNFTYNTCSKSVLFKNDLTMTIGEPSNEQAYDYSEWDITISGTVSGYYLSPSFCPSTGTSVLTDKYFDAKMNSAPETVKYRCGYLFCWDAIPDDPMPSGCEEHFYDNVDNGFATFSITKTNFLNNQFPGYHTITIFYYDAVGDFSQQLYRPNWLSKSVVIRRKYLGEP